ncbi:MAG: hypothetical protein EOO53_18730 [Gammaproteobacteria bacterium]|nr:MAG: hypothetical protein EOO53_18730 [Gammaproteobacteria bacterium]
MGFLPAGFAASDLLEAELITSALGATNFSAEAGLGFTPLLGCAGAAFLATGLTADVAGLDSVKVAAGFSAITFGLAVLVSAGLLASTDLFAGADFFAAGAAFFATGLAAGLGAACSTLASGAGGFSLDIKSCT